MVISPSQWASKPEQLSWRISTEAKK